jgi:hypothetical protein
MQVRITKVDQLKMPPEEQFTILIVQLHNFTKRVRLDSHIQGDVTAELKDQTKLSKHETQDALALLLTTFSTSAKLFV